MKRFSKLLIIFLVLITITSFVWSLFQSQEMDGRFRGSTVYGLERPDRWEVLFGDIPFVNGKPDVENVEWVSLAKLLQDGTIKSNTFNKYEGYYWVRRTLPNVDHKDPHLMISYIKSYEIFIEGEKRFSFHMPPSPPIVNEHNRKTLVPINEIDKGKQVYFRIYSHGTLPFLMLGSIVYGNMGDIFTFILQTEIGTFCFGLIFLIVGIISTLLYLRHYKNVLYLSFALFTLTAAVGTLNRTTLLHWLINPELLVYLPDNTIQFGLFALMLFIESISTGRYRIAFRIIGFSGLLYTAASFVLLQVNIGMLDFLLNIIMPYHLLISTLIALILLIKMHIEQKTVETKSLLIGFAGAFFFVMTNIIHFGVPVISAWIINYTYPLYSIIMHSTYIGILWFITAMGFVLYHRFTELNKKVKQYAEETSYKLQESLRETAATLAELSVVEERNKIARDVHDIVGHTLTTTVVQIEAARMLISKDREEGIEKLDTASKLVRKSMDDIRHSMKSLTQSSDWDLRAALSKLMEDTESVTGIKIEYDIEEPPPLRTSDKKVLFHALQEGLTNGIRHGECKEFQFQLRNVEGKVEFVLDNDGKLFEGSKPGFGLTAMRERVEGIGGTFEIGSPNGLGCRITIVLPSILN